MSRRTDYNDGGITCAYLDSIKSCAQETDESCLSLPHFALDTSDLMRFTESGFSRSASINIFVNNFKLISIIFRLEEFLIYPNVSMTIMIHISMSLSPNVQCKI